MQGILGTIIFIVIVVASIAQKIQERRAAKGALKPLTREDIPEEARRRLYGDTAAEPRVASPKAAAGERPGGPEAVREARPARRVAPPPVQAPGKELFDSLFGGGAVVDQAEEPRPAPSPAPRRAEPPRRVPASTTAREQPREARVPPSRAKQTAPRPTQRNATGRPQSRQAKPGSGATRGTEGKTRREKKVARQDQPRPPSRIAPPAGPLVLFTSVDDVRRGIILAEILGPPKALALQEGP